MTRSADWIRSPALKVLGGFAVAYAAASFLPRSDGGSSPPVGQLLEVAALVTLFTTGALYLVIRRNLRLPAAVAVYAVAFNALIVLVKFVLGPLGLYEVNDDIELTSLFPVSDEVGATWTATLVLALYALGYFAVYRLARARLAGLPRADTRGRRRVVLPLVVAAYAAAGAGVALAVLAVGGGAAQGIDEYVAFVLSSSVSLLIAVALAVAGALVALAFRGAAEHAETVGDAAVVASFFWVGLAFLALYHVLWVVYVLALTAIWPLRVVVPK